MENINKNNQAYRMKEIIKDLNENTLNTPVVIIFPDGCPEANWKPRNLSEYPNMKGKHMDDTKFFPVIGNLDMYVENITYWGFVEGLVKATNRHKIVISPIYKEWKLLVQACLYKNIPFVFALPRESNLDFLFRYHDQYKLFKKLNVNLNNEGKEIPDFFNIPSDFEISNVVADIEKFASENLKLIPIINTAGVGNSPNRISEGKVFPVILIKEALYEGRYIPSNIWE